METFKYCPHCGNDGLAWDGCKRWACGECGFVYYHNMAAAVAAVLLYQDEILLTLRKNKPAQGMLDLPGGFVNHDESLEQALTREIDEELSIAVAVKDWRYLFSYPNRYEYSGILYYTSDAFFLKALELKPVMIASDDVADAEWVRIKDVALEKIGLDSVRNAMGQLQQNHPAFVRGSI